MSRKKVERSERRPVDQATAAIATPAAESAEHRPTPSGEAAQSRSRRWAAPLGGLALHLALTAFFTWPLLGDLLTGSATTPGFMAEDRDQNLWNLWWTKTALFDLHTNPFASNFIYWPDGVSLQFHTLNIFNGLISIPFQAFLPLPAIYNGIVFGSFVLAGWGAYLLLTYLLARRQPAGWAIAPGAIPVGAAIGSSVFAYSAYHLATQRGLLQLISVEWIPFYVLCLLRAVHEGPGGDVPLGWRRGFVRRALPAAGCLLLVALVDWYYVMYALLFTALYGLYVLAQRVRVGRQAFVAVAGIAVVVALFLAVVSPLLLSMFDEIQHASYMRPAPGEALADSADLLAFFIPPRLQQLWGALSSVRATWPFASNQYEVYLGYVALALTGVALFDRRQRDVRVPFGLPGRAFWAVSGGIFGLFALGPVLQVNGVQYPGVPMPYNLLAAIPGANISRSPDRFDMPLTLCLGVLAGYGALRVAGRVAGFSKYGYLRGNVSSSAPQGGEGRVRGESRLTLPLAHGDFPPSPYPLSGGEREQIAQPRKNPPSNAFAARGVRTYALGAGLLALLALELWPVPYPQLAAPIPAYFQTLGQDPGDYAILELPREDSYWHGAFRMYFQTAHHKRIFYGYISREYYHPFLFSTPGFMELQNPDGLPDLFADGPPEWLSALVQYNTRYVVLYKAGWRSRPAPDQTAAYRAEVAKILGADTVAHPVHSDADMDVYAVPAPATAVPYLSLGTGWGQREATPQESHRWMQNEATLRLNSPRSFRGSLVFQAVPLGPPRTLIVRRDGGAATTLTIDGQARTYRVDLGQAPAGVSMIDLSSPGALLTPKELGMSQDSRQLGISFSQVRLEVAP